MDRFSRSFMSDNEFSVMAQALAGLGHEVRLKLYRRLVRAGHGGVNAGTLAREMGLAPSTLAHHLATLAECRLITQERQGRETISRADYGTMNGLVGFLTRECCEDEGGAGGADRP